MEKPKKTWSREVSTVLLFFLLFLAYKGQTEELEILIWPFTVFSMAAFGFKQPVIEGRFSRDRDVRG